MRPPPLVIVFWVITSLVSSIFESRLRDFPVDSSDASEHLCLDEDSGSTESKFLSLWPSSRNKCEGFWFIISAAPLKQRSHWYF